MCVNWLLEESARRTPARTAVICGAERRSYRDLDEQSNRLAHALIAAGVSPGERVAVYRDNSIDTVAAIFAVLKAGAVFVVINPQARADRVISVLADSGAGILITTRRPAGLPGDVITFTTCDAPECPSTPPPLQRGSDDLAALVYTSGSTGASKGVMLTHGNLLAAAGSICEYLEITASDVILNVLPLAFTYGLGQITTAFRAGATVVLGRSIYARDIVDTIVRERVTGFPLVPTIATLILQQDLTTASFKHLRYITNAAAALSNVKIQRLRKAFPHTKLYSMYGQTECQRATYLPPDQIDAKPASVGIAIPGTSVWIVDRDGHPAAPGEIGELVVSGPHVMKGYWHQSEQTARVLRRDALSEGYALYTGDLFRMDREGCLYFVDRLDDIIKTRGEKVAPREVEELIAQLPGVAEVSVYGVPDDMLGEAVAAAVVVVPGASLTRADVQRHCLERLESLMVPRVVEIREALPTTASGKVSRRALRAAAVAGEVPA